MESLLGLALSIVERGYVPDVLVRQGVRSLLQGRLQEEDTGNVVDNVRKKQQFIEYLKGEAIALSTAEANEQHYEVPAEFYVKVLDRSYLKYSSCYFGFDGANGPSVLPSLEDAAKAMLDLYCERAELKDGLSILDLGCGWGSTALYIAQKYPNSKIIGVSNSNSQRVFIQNLCKQRKLNNLTIITGDVNHFDIDELFDRVISIEMFEHMKNYERLMEKISTWLKPNGKLFVHIFSHITFAYNFTAKSNSDWMAKHFFTNGTMPSDDLLLYFQTHLKIKNHWRLDGRNYGETCRLWLKNLDNNQSDVIKLFETTYGKDNAYMWFIRWRLFFIACGELFNIHNGQEWIVSHYLFEKVHSTNKKANL